jgi:hypothetical protein
MTARVSNESAAAKRAATLVDDVDEVDEVDQ